MNQVKWPRSVIMPVGGGFIKAERTGLHMDDTWHETYEAVGEGFALKRCCKPHPASSIIGSGCDWFRWEAR